MSTSNLAAGSVIHGHVDDRHDGGGSAERVPSGVRHRERHTVIVSDVHLSQTHPEDPSDPLWMRYRTAAYHPDADFAALIDRMLGEVGAGSLELVFNGDLFDFDAPWVKDGQSSFDEFPLDDAGCAAQVARVVADHPGWFRATARVLAAGHRVLFLSGNHDLELYWPGVRAAIRRALEEHVRALGDGNEIDDVASRIRFRTWFHVTEDRIYLEHGSQYDMLNGVPDPMRPVLPDGTTIHPVCGKLAFKRTGSRMGYFNPYYEETFYMGLFGYLGHFARCYALTKRDIVRTWAKGAFGTCLEVWRHRTGKYGEISDLSVERACEETGATPEQVRATHALAVTPAEKAMLPILRELWVDRTLLASALLAAIAVLALTLGPLPALFAGAGLVVAFVVYEGLTPKPDIRTYDSAPPSVRRLLDVHGVRAMCFGHTHRASSTWGDDGRFVGNSGTWSPAFEDQACTRPVLAARPLLWMRTAGDELSGGLFWWRRGNLVPGDGVRDRRDGVAPERAVAE